MSDPINNTLFGPVVFSVAGRPTLRGPSVVEPGPPTCYFCGKEYPEIGQGEEVLLPDGTRTFVVAAFRNYCLECWNLWMGGELTPVK
jgi:hypothetical protein